MWAMLSSVVKLHGYRIHTLEYIRQTMGLMVWEVTDEGAYYHVLIKIEKKKPLHSIIALYFGISKHVGV